MSRSPRTASGPVDAAGHTRIALVGCLIAATTLVGCSSIRGSCQGASQAELDAMHGTIPDTASTGWSELKAVESDGCGDEDIHNPRVAVYYYPDSSGEQLTRSDFERVVKSTALEEGWVRRECGPGQAVSRDLDGSPLILGTGGAESGGAVVVVSRIVDWPDHCSGA